MGGALRRDLSRVLKTECCEEVNSNDGWDLERWWGRVASLEDHFYSIQKEI